MSNSSLCLTKNCEQQPVVDVVVNYPPDAMKTDGKESQASYCLDCIGTRVTGMLKVGEAVSIAIMRIGAV